MEPIRRAALVKATIDEVGLAGSLEVTVSQIAKRAGVSSGLAHHYFGGKEQIFLAAMRHILSVYGAQVRVALSIATTPRERLEGIILASFEASNFRSEVVGSWLNFYVLAHRSVGAKRLLSIYQRRLRSNLIHDLRPLIPESQLENSAQGIAALIDGLYIRRSLGAQNTSDPISITKIYLASILNQKEVK
ncbi:transcriptional repressor BetI [Falsihalocynthiibacter arcticus]|uniref:HTH-type transcriptional regulator BetI n=2 Tax=Falsihalocynthiibacter arcticus TaxID=1579316 RepID=A0A126V5A7_9RHOB|nr:transcriptional repressor BetI [Falsihalocynthiibacter arcticus]